MSRKIGQILAPIFGIICLLLSQAAYAETDEEPKVTYVEHIGCKHDRAIAPPCPSGKCSYNAKLCKRTTGPNGVIFKVSCAEENARMTNRKLQYNKAYVTMKSEDQVDARTYTANMKNISFKNAGVIIRYECVSPT